MKVFYIGLYVVFFFGVGLLITKFSSQFPQEVVEQTHPFLSRDPAAIRRVYDFSELDGSALDQASKQRLVSGAKILKEADEIGVELGHFVVRGQDGQKAFACQKYSRIILQFEGDGSASNGEKPSMEVEGSCEISTADINSISPLWIPVAKILGEPVADGEFDFREGHAIKVRFANVMQEWPSLWRLRGVKLLDQNETGKEVSIGDKEIHQFSDHPFIVNFK
jgi:hypothetical protein